MLQITQANPTTASLVGSFIWPANIVFVTTTRKPSKFVKMEGMAILAKTDDIDHVERGSALGSKMSS